MEGDQELNRESNLINSLKKDITQAIIDYRKNTGTC